RDREFTSAIHHASCRPRSRFGFGSMAHAHLSLLVAILDFSLSGHTDTQVLQQAVAQPINPTMNRQGLSPRPSVAYDCRLTDVDHLFDDIQPGQAAMSLGLGFQHVDLRQVFAAYILYVAKPVVDQT